MAEKSGFFNALLNEGEYDRKYNANDYSDNLAVVISNGVLRSINDDLKVTASGMVASVGIGRAWINGHYYNNTSVYTFPAVTAPVATNRYDRIMLRLDNSLAVRKVSLTYVQGTAAATPTKPAPVRSGDVYDLVLADIYVAAGATSVTVTDTRSDANLCGWIYSTSGDGSFFESLDAGFNEWFAGVRDTLSSVTLFKRYTQNITVASATSTVSFNIPQYDAETCFAEVYVNGILDNRHTITNNVITFVGTLTAGTVVTVNAYKSIDGTGIMTVSDEITELQNDFATLDGISKFTYKCTGLNDNISLSQIAQAIIEGSYSVGTLSQAAEAFLNAIGGNTYLATIATDEQVTIAVSGNLGVTTPHSGAGTASDRYKWFYFGKTTVQNKRVIFDFAKCKKVNIACAANTNNIIFFGNDVFVKNLDITARSTNASCAITMTQGANSFGTVRFDNCYMKVITTGKAMIAENGDFTNCYCDCRSAGNNAYCFDVNTNGIVRINGGTFYAYKGSGTGSASIINIESTQTNGVVMAQNINCPTSAITGYYQEYLVKSNAGMAQIYGVCSTLNSMGAAANRNIVGQIWKSKH